MKILLSLIFFTFLFAQTPDPNRILNDVKLKYKEVSDYSADVRVDVDLNLIKIKNTKGKVYYKSPDKFKFNSVGFGLLPKQAGNINPDLLLKDDHTALFLREENLDSTIVNVIRIIPMIDSTDLILSTLWIDKEKLYLRKIESNTKTAGTIKINISYDHEINFPLPSSIAIELNGGKPDETKKEKRTFSSSKSLYGNVLIKYSKYQINTGIDDKIFKEK